MTRRDDMEAAVEAVLFISSEPVPRSRLLQLFDEADQEEAEAAIAAVLERYAAAPERGVQMEEVAGGVRLVTRPDMNEWLRRFFEVTGATKLSMAALETLAIIAYRQPVTGPEIQELRSVNPSGVLKTLLDRHLVRIAGRKEVVGRPFLYCTTREFLVHFGLKSLKDLPPLEEFEEAFEEGADGEAAPEPGLDAGPGRDREEVILRRAAELEEGDGGASGEEGPLAAEESPADEPPSEESEPADETARPDAPAPAAKAAAEAADDAGEQSAAASDTLDGERADEAVPAGSPS